MSQASPKADRILRDSETFVELLRQRASETPEAIALRFLDDGETESSTLTYAQLDREARAVAARLQVFAEPGDRALLLYPPGQSFVTAFFGCFYARVVPVPAYPPEPGQRLERLRRLAHDAEATIVLTVASMVDLVASAQSELGLTSKARFVATDNIPLDLAEDWTISSPRADDVAFLQYTSGSTGNPKGVVVTHRNIICNMRMIQDLYATHAKSVFVSWLPVYHDMGLIGNVMHPLSVGCSGVVMPPRAFLSKPLRWLKAVSRYRGTVTGAPNFAYDLCVRKLTPADAVGLDLSSLQIAYNGAEPVRHDTMQRFAETFKPYGFSPNALFPCYGMAEATLLVSGGPVGRGVRTISLDATELEQHRIVKVSADAPNARTLVSCGVVRTQGSVLIVPADASAKGMMTGEIWIAGGNVARDYWNGTNREPIQDEDNPFRARSPQDQKRTYYRTGDLGFLEDGELYVTGRVKDLIIVNGRNHYPQDIELTVENAHEAIRPGCIAAFALQGTKSEEVGIVAEVHKAALEMDLKTVCEAIVQAVGLNHELRVAKLALVEPGSVLKTSSGKIQRSATRAALLKEKLAVVAQGDTSFEITKTLKVATKRHPEGTPSDKAPTPVTAKEPKAAEPSNAESVSAPPVSASPKPLALAIVPATKAPADPTATAPQKRPKPSPEAAPISAQELSEHLHQWLAQKLELPADKIDRKIPLASYGMDSVIAVELADHLEKHALVKLSPNAVFEAGSLEGLVQRITNLESTPVKKLV